MVAATPASMPAEHAEALNRILAVTRREWGLEASAPNPNGPTASRPAPQAPRARGTRRKQLAQIAARAFEAQVMALRCRQAFVV